MTARLINIARGSMHDGPGVRTVVYFKGCNLVCRWCHNPESQAFAPEVVFHESKCIGCGRCSESCSSQVIRIEQGKARIRYKHCIRCYCCHEMCPVKAIHIRGRV